MARFTFLIGDVDWQTYGGKWISEKLNNGEFDYWLVMELINWHEAVGEDEAPAMYHVALSVISPQEAEPELQRAAESWGIAVEELDTDEKKIECLHSYGVYVPIWQQDGNNYRKLMTACRKFARQEASILFGFIMDRPVNQIGTTGWEALRGDLLAGLNRVPENPETELMQKISGITPQE